MAAVVTSVDGYRETFPLSWLVEQGAVLATEVGGEPLERSVGGTNQLWIPGVSARLFIRDVVSIDFVEVDEEPRVPSFEAEGMVFQNRPNVSVREDARSCEPYRVGDVATFEGYAYDYDRAIAAVEFSLDGGVTWDRRPVEGATGDRWVSWTYAVAVGEPGTHRLTVRSVNELGEVSPTPATCLFEVCEERNGLR